MRYIALIVLGFALSACGSSVSTTATSKPYTVTAPPYTDPNGYSCFYTDPGNGVYCPSDPAATGSPSAAVGSPSAAGSPSAPHDPAVAVCQGFAAIYPFMNSRLLAEADVVNPAAMNLPDWKLYADAGKMAHWTHVMTQAVTNGTTNATVQFANDLGDAATEVSAASQPPNALSTPDPLTALVDIDRVRNDCSSLTG